MIYLRTYTLRKRMKKFPEFIHRKEKKNISLVKHMITGIESTRNVHYRR